MVRSNHPGESSPEKNDCFDNLSGRSHHQNWLLLGVVEHLSLLPTKVLLRTNLAAMIRLHDQITAECWHSVLQAHVTIQFLPIMVCDTIVESIHCLFLLLWIKFVKIFGSLFFMYNFFNSSLPMRINLLLAYDSQLKYYY